MFVCSLKNKQTNCPSLSHVEKGADVVLKVSLKSHHLQIGSDPEGEGSPAASLQPFIRGKTPHLPRSISETRYSTEPTAVCSPTTTSKEYLSLLNPGWAEVVLAVSIIFTLAMSCDAMLRSFSLLRRSNHAPVFKSGV